MSRFRRVEGGLSVKLEEYESALLESLAEQLVSLLSADEIGPAVSDPFAAWEAELGEEPLDTSDPVLARLFPSAYTDDADAEADFRRYTESTQRRTKIEQAGVVLAAIRAGREGRGRVLIPAAATQAWLQTVSALRLSLAVRLGIETADDAARLEALEEDDPRAFVHHVYEWLGYFVESLLAKL